MHAKGRFIAIHNKYSKIPPSNPMPFTKWCAKFACCSSELIFKLLYAWSSIQNARELAILLLYSPLICKFCSSSKPTDKIITKFLWNFNETWIFPTDFLKRKFYHISWKIRRVGTELFHADGQTNTTQLLVASRIFCEKRQRRFLPLPTTNLRNRRSLSVLPFTLCPNIHYLSYHSLSVLAFTLCPNIHYLSYHSLSVLSFTLCPTIH